MCVLFILTFDSLPHSLKAPGVNTLLKKDKRLLTRQKLSGPMRCCASPKACP